MIFYDHYGCIPENLRERAITLRIHHFTRYIFDILLVTYFARREYRYDVNVRALITAFALGNSACILHMNILKKFVIWPFVSICLVFYLSRSQ